MPAESGTIRASSGAITAAVLGLAAGSIAAGSIGLTAHSLGHGLAWVALGLAVVAAWPKHTYRSVLLHIALLAAAGIAAVVMIASPLQPLNVLAVSIVLLALAEGSPTESRAAVLFAAQATAILGIYRFAYTSIPLVWYAADGLGWALGSVAAFITRRPLWAGATMGGVDYLVPMLYLAVALPLAAGRTRRTLRRMLIAAGIVLAANLVYLLLLSFAADVVAWLGPEPTLSAADKLSPNRPAIPLAAACASALRKLVPWDVPSLAAAIQCAVAWGLFRWFLPPASAAESMTARRKMSECSYSLSRLRFGILLGCAAAAVACVAMVLPALTVLCIERTNISGKKIVFFEKGYVNWLKPEHGQYGRLSVGMYGMLPTFLESLGARTRMSSDLSEKDLQDADALVIIYPNEDYDECWKGGKLERIDKFVRDGGSLLVMGEHTVREKDGASRINDVLAPTAMRVPFDSALYAIGGWLHCYDAMAHPITTGIGDQRNEFGVVVGASVAARWPARPLLIGRWGWADRGDPSNGEAKLGNERYDAGEKLGDVLLAAEQRIGRGKVVCFGDPSMLINGLTPGCHEFTSRLFTYLLGGGATPQASWRQAMGLAAVVVLWAVLLLPTPWPAVRVLAVALPLAASLALCTGITQRAWDVIPDGGRKKPNNLAYIDAGHLNADTPESWREDGLGAFQLTLMRNGYLPLLLSDTTPERLDKARLLFIDAPAREYSAAECDIVENYVKKGGIVILTVGYERVGPSQRLLSTFGFRVGPTKEKEERGEKPKPLGHFKSPFFNGGDYYAFVRFHAAWPVYCDDPKAMLITQYSPGKPVIIVRRVEKGLAVVIGDTCFAMMKNLENEDGSPIEGKRENADFWRWFLALLGEGEPWYPPKPAIEAPPGGAAPPVEPKPADEPQATPSTPRSAE